MKRKILIASLGILIAFIGYFVVRGNRADESANIMSVVKRGKFKVEIETTGELEAKNFVKIQGPEGLRNFSIYQVTIQNIVDEGTIVKKGDWVATLDRSEFQTKFLQKQIDLETANSKFVQTQLDTTLEMRKSRDELINLKYAVEEKEIIREQSKFEPPSTVKQTEIDLDKAKRAYQQAIDNYKIKKNQNIEKMRVVGAELRKVTNEFDGMNKILQSFNVKAPDAGMVIYERDWDGKPVKAGSQIRMWDPVVATLPDLTTMQSKTFVNEVDIRKIKPGQKVEVGLDAYPDKKLTGKVIHVANVGEQRPNSDAKVFEVLVEIDGTDMSLRPAMTTSNKIIAHEVDEVLHIPLECLHNEHDSITYVFVQEGIKITKQEVIVGETNSNEAVVLKGVVENDRLFLSMPPDVGDQKIQLLPELNGKRKKKKEEEPAKSAEPAQKVMRMPPSK
ncbi:MAG: efflux RND transporter periplasmic adaptor subunit [Bacteroidetes bacterium]|nr:efflux RND transporter periplasmic adaptor subunit [Bacteroidota bacterium]